jgi:hypothetical protein
MDSEHSVAKFKNNNDENFWNEVNPRARSATETPEMISKVNWEEIRGYKQKKTRAKSFVLPTTKLSLVTPDSFKGDAGSTASGAKDQVQALLPARKQPIHDLSGVPEDEEIEATSIEIPIERKVKRSHSKLLRDLHADLTRSPVDQNIPDPSHRWFRKNS